MQHSLEARLQHHTRPASQWIASTAASMEPPWAKVHRGTAITSKGGPPVGTAVTRSRPADPLEARLQCLGRVGQCRAPPSAQPVGRREEDIPSSAAAHHGFLRGSPEAQTL